MKLYCSGEKRFIIWTLSDAYLLRDAVCSWRHSGWTEEWLPLNMSTPHPITSTRPPSASSINIRSQKHMPVCGSILKTSPNQTVVSGTSQTELLVLPLWKWSCYVLHVLFREARRPQSKSAATNPCHPDFGNRTWQALEIVWLLQRLHSTRSWAKEGFFFSFQGCSMSVCQGSLRGEKDS